MPSPTDVEVRDWLDRLAIEALIHRYADAVTRADWPQCEAVFSPQAIWESPQLGLRFEGSAAFLDMLRETSESCELLLHIVSSPVVRLEGPARATASTTVKEVVRGVNVVDTATGAAGTPVNVEQHGIYCDEVERIDGQWLFVHRVFTLLYVESGQVAGDVMAPRSSLAGLVSGLKSARGGT
jgi:hypothetical protein